MILRRKRLKTKQLQELAAPIELEELLQNLVTIGHLEWYKIGANITTIKLTKTAGLDTILKEASAPIINPRPYVANKSNVWKTTKR